MKYFVKSALVISLIGVVSQLGYSTQTYAGAEEKPGALKRKSTFPVGFAIDPQRIKNDDLYRSVVVQEGKSITVANDMKPSRISPQKGAFNFDKADYALDFAKKQKIRVHGHTMVWYINTAPEWLKQITDSTELENTLKDYISTVGSHFKGKVASWDVVNEAFENDGTIRVKSVDSKGKTLLNLGKVIGKDYIARMFQYARKADPGALLFYNDYGQETSPKKLDAIVDMARDFKRRGIPIQGLGLQMHMNIDTPENGIESALQKLAETGLLIHISELDISMNVKKTAAFEPTTDDLKRQREKYQFVVAAYKRIVPERQQFGITMWGVGDADSWIPGFCECTDFALLFDKTYQPKPVYDGFLNGL